MEHILETRRVFFDKKVVEPVEEWIKNPEYNPHMAHQCNMQGLYYPVEEFILVMKDKLITKRGSHIEYRIRCAYCKGEDGWVRRRDARFCSAACRRLYKLDENTL